jgi:hypothetical protein
MPTVIANNPDLTHLDVRAPIGHAPSLREILGEIPQSGGPPLQLQHLGLISCATSLDVVTLRHLQSLTSFKLHDHRDDLDSCNVWDALLSADVRLTALDTDCVGGKLLNYLASYSGLKILKLQSLFKADDLANQFFRDILPNHADSLETLRLDPQNESSWCLGSGTLDSVLQCHKLVKLGFAMVFDTSVASVEKWDKEIEIHPVVYSSFVSLRCKLTAS